MCIMEVRPGQEATTIAQALTHNVSTSERDAEMFRILLVSRGDVENLSRVERAQVALANAYRELLEVFGGELAHAVDHGHNPDSTIGNERAEHTHERPEDREMIEQAAAIAATRARRFETR